MHGEHNAQDEGELKAVVRPTHLSTLDHRVCCRQCRYRGSLQAEQSGLPAHVLQLGKGSSPSNALDLSFCSSLCDSPVSTSSSPRLATFWGAISPYPHMLDYRPPHHSKMKAYADMEADVQEVNTRMKQARYPRSWRRMAVDLTRDFWTMKASPLSTFIDISLSLSSFSPFNTVTQSLVSFAQTGHLRNSYVTTTTIAITVPAMIKVIANINVNTKNNRDNVWALGCGRRDGH
ncbi:hypothetical protein CPB84DRAFT_1970148 [Gymnopilus junonius]|uniref:Uncharacterized protein n=1 Tax=Gymnopilus junonius TaxID=109634 RepID=A0A9P5TEA9_GYMJU|nr:hypothetical protein CPB84DRAFT_1970148 [Gymnopilus junonius]